MEEVVHVDEVTRDTDEITSVLMNLAIVDKYWGFYYACGPDRKTWSICTDPTPKGRYGDIGRTTNIPVT